MKNFSNIKQEVEEMTNVILKNHNLKVYEVNNFEDFESDVLQILIEDAIQPNKALDFDVLMSVNEAISNAMEKFDAIIKDPYMLEVASAGIEKRIRSKEELANAIDQYVHLELHKAIANSKVIEGFLTEFNVDTQEFKIEYFIKGQKKKSYVKWDDISACRYAVKF
ncbi:ribosome maturation factor RimP [Mesoplasma photuris]|uniref:ribosome maturation factor RimP n=1 Tax=Mesoplasma photuris TaxID=217731 RepID=UPI0004E18D6D|nr:ribosome maturation factor RimP [Mesoplasma photuris]